MSEETSGPKELREAYERAKERIAHLENVNRGFVLEKAGVPEKARGLVTKALGDDADWTDANAIKSLLTEHGLSFGEASAPEDGNAPPPMTAEDSERVAAQARMDAMRSAGAPPHAGPPDTKTKIAEAQQAGDLNTALSLKHQQMFEAAGINP